MISRKRLSFRDWLTKCATRRFVLFAFELPAMLVIVLIAVVWKGGL